MSMVSVKQCLLNLRKELLVDLEQGMAAAEVVELDQNRVGRLSRMDAMQQQEMQKAGQLAIRKRLADIDKALELFAQDEYGFCLNCGGDIAESRLAARPEALLCIRCASAAEQ